MQRQIHIPVLLGEITSIARELIETKNTIKFLDCTLGMGGHSKALYEQMERGVLLSIDLNLESIEWVATQNEMYKTDNGFERTDGIKVWRLMQFDFAEIDKLNEKFDLILADLGYSAFELNQNIGISFSSPHQNLDMRYRENGLKASEFLNTAKEEEIVNVLLNFSDINKQLAYSIAGKVIRNRQKRAFHKVIDLSRIISPNGNIRTKVFQALRVFINEEYSKLTRLCNTAMKNLEEGGVLAIITFNNDELSIVKEHFPSCKSMVPNIAEIIRNIQSRSAKLHTIKKNK